MNNQKPKILAIDDDEGILQALQFMLEMEGYEVILDDGRAVFNKIAFKPNLIILDMIIPGIDGRMLAKRIKSQPEFKNIPIIFMSAHPSASKEYKKYGADDFLAKPFDNDMLLGLIKRYLNTN